MKTILPARLFHSFADARLLQSLAAATALTCGLMAASPAAAHQFTAAILSVGDGREARLTDAVRGFLLAADERDGHPNETSDGHLGGVDVNVLPLSAGVAVHVEGLTGEPAAIPHVVVVVGPEKDAAAAMIEAARASVVMRPGTLPQRAVWTEATNGTSFAARYIRAYGTAPTEAAAEGYNAARRLELAVRPLDGAEPREALSSALAKTEAGIGW